MSFHRGLLAVLLVLLVFVGVGWGQAAGVGLPISSNSRSGGDEDLSEAYVGRITGSDVNVRSGPGQVYYAVTQLDEGQLVIVRAERHGRRNWAHIDAPVGSFSFIAKEFVDLVVEAAEPAAAGGAVASRAMLGRVSGNNVRVRAGAISVAPANADQVQTRLNRGAIVEIIGEQDDYYKIVCPDGARFWVSLDYVERVGPVTAEVVADLEQESSQQIPGELGSDTELSQAQLDRQEYREIADLLTAEQAKPISEQDYVAIRERLEALIAATEYENIKLDGGYLLRNVARSELALEIWQRAQQREVELQRALDRIEATAAEVMVSNSYGADEAAPIMKVRLTRAATDSTVEGKQLYQVRDSDENIMCYAVSMHDRLDLGEYIDETVSLAGRFRRGSNVGGLRILYVTSVVLEVEPVVVEEEEVVEVVEVVEEVE